MCARLSLGRRKLACMEKTCAELHWLAFGEIWYARTRAELHWPTFGERAICYTE